MTLREYLAHLLNDMVSLSQTMFAGHPLGQKKHLHLTLSSENAGSAGGTQ
jgi:hypothetical protein